MQLEYNYYIPPDVLLNDDGSIPAAELNKVYSFDDRDTFFMYDETGWGMPAIEYITQQGPFQHGETPIDYRLKTRIIQFTHRKNACNRFGYWDNRSGIINLLRPNRQFVNTFLPGRLRKILPNGEIRDLYVLIDSGPAFTQVSDSWNEYSFNESLRFIAHNPIIFDPELNEAAWVLESQGNLIFYEPVNWENRLVFEGNALDTGGIWFRESSIGDVIYITYTGTWQSYPMFIITGPLEKLRILNSTTNEKIELDYDVALGETVTINLEYGQKTVSNNFGTNLAGTVTTDSDLATFHLAPDPEALNGVNALTVFGDNADIANTQVKLTWYTRYIGI